MALATVATATNTNGDVWHVAAASGQHLLTVKGAESAVLGPAKASLIADWGYPAGEWARRGPGRYAYVVLR